ncbi:MAG: nucleotide exchange factor GrpE [Nitrospira sp.]
MTDDTNRIDLEEEVDTDPGDDVVFEENSEVTAPDLHAKLEKLRSRVKELEKKNTELLDSWQRDKAEFINARKNDENAKSEFLKFAKADLISEIIPALDSFDNAMKNKEVWEKVDANWRVGIEYIRTQLLNSLANHGLKVVNPMGEMYNEKRDEAIETVKVDNKEQDGKILDVVQVGYELNGKEIRAPKVKVTHFE